MNNFVISRSSENTDDVLKHYGVLGMKWGVRKFRDSSGVLTAEGKNRYKQYKQDRKSVKTTTRHVSAGARNLKERTKAQINDQNNYNDARKELRRVNGKIYAPWNKKKKRTNVQNATDRVTESARNWERTKAEQNRAERIYDSDTKELQHKVNQMINKYGQDSVKTIKTKTVNIGKNYTKEFVKTGITVANLPIVGTKYTARYIDRRDNIDRQIGVNDASRRHYY